MVNMPALRLYAAVVAALMLATAVPARAQYRPRPISDPATGEVYHVEGSVGLWFPSADITISSAGTGALAGIPGTPIDFVSDLGLTDQRFPPFKLVLRATRRNKFRVEFIPISYTQSATLTRSIVFNGQRFPPGATVSSTLDWKAWRFAYEFDFLSRDRWFVGLVLDAKYTDVQATLQSAKPSINEFDHAKVWIPAIGGIGRVYFVPNISLTAELTGFKMPDIGSQTIGGVEIPKYRGHYTDFDTYATVNFNNYVGAQVGYRLIDGDYLVNQDAGTMTLKGLYFGVVLRY